MSKSRSNKKTYNRYRSPRFIFAATMAGILVFIFVVTLFATPTTTTQTTDIDQLELNTPVPTEFRPPTPHPDGPQLTFNNTVIQNNGWFQVTIPSDFTVQNNSLDSSVPHARIEFRAAQRLSIVDVLLQFGVNYPSHEALAEDFFQDSYFISVWRDYDGFTETDRSVGESIVIDFDLSAQQVDYLGRQVAWLDGDWLHMVRFIVPENNPALLDALTEGVLPRVISYNALRDSQLTWTSYNDPLQGFVVRHPSWRQISGEVGGPAILEASNLGARLLLRRYDATTLDSLDAAEAFVRDTLDPGAEINGVQAHPTTRDTEGYLVSYATRDSDGNLISGLASLLNTSDGQLAVADVQYQEAGIDLLSLNDTPGPQQIRQVIDSFILLPDDDAIGGAVENPVATIPPLQAPNLSPDQISTLEAQREN